MRDTVTEAAAQIESVIDAAEQAAIEIKEEAVAKADAYLSGRQAEADELLEAQRARLDAMTGPLVERAQAIQRDARHLADEIESTLETFAAERAERDGELSSAVEASPDDDAQELSAHEADEVDADDGASSGTSLEASEGINEEALLRVTQMAVAQSDRAEIEATLREEFGIEDPAPVVDEILGPVDPDRSAV